MLGKNVNTILKTSVDRHIAILETKSFSFLQEMDSFAEEIISTRAGPITIATWKDSNNDSVRVIVQAYKRNWFGFGWIHAQGFRMFRTGKSEPVRDAEISEFI